MEPNILIPDKGFLFRVKLYVQGRTCEIATKNLLKLIGRPRAYLKKAVVDRDVLKMGTGGGHYLTSESRELITASQAAEISTSTPEAQRFVQRQVEANAADIHKALKESMYLLTQGKEGQCTVQPQTTIRRLRELLLAIEPPAEEVKPQS